MPSDNDGAHVEIILQSSSHADKQKEVRVEVLYGLRRLDRTTHIARRYLSSGYSPRNGVTFEMSQLVAGTTLSSDCISMRQVRSHSVILDG